MSISLCSIIKNEMKHLPEFVRCFEDFVDEFVWTDTGSTDGSLAFTHPKVRIAPSSFFSATSDRDDFDFSVARNESIERATGEWVMNIDPDYRATPEALAKLKKCFLSPDMRKHDAVALTVASGPEHVCQCIFIRKASGLRYVSPVHETIPLAQEKALFFSDISLQHLRTFDSISEEDNTRKREWYARIILRQMRKNPNSLHLQLLLSQELRNLKRYQDALGVCDQILFGPNAKQLGNISRSRVLLISGDCLLQLNHSSLAMGQWKEALKSTPDNPMLLWAVGELYRLHGDLDEAEAYYRAAAACKKPDHVYMVDYPIYRGEKPANGLRLIAEQRQRVAQPATAIA